MLICSKCGLNSEDDSRYCKRCGAVLATVSFSPPPQYKSSTNRNLYDKNNRTFTCARCGIGNFETIKVCQNCGAKLYMQKGNPIGKQRTWRFIGLTAVICIAFGVFSLIKELTPSPPQPVSTFAETKSETKPEAPAPPADPPAVQMSTGIRKTIFGIEVTNKTSRPYQDVKVEINYGLMGGYSARLKLLRAGESIDIPYSSFLNSSSDRFNINTKAAERVMVTATIDGKRDWEEFY